MLNALQTANEEMAAIVAATRSSLVRIRNGRRGVGAGTIWHSDGLIVTNAHVVAGRGGAQSGKLTVTLADGRMFPARLLAWDPRRDVAALSIDGRDLPTVQLAPPGHLRAGDWVVALGHPWGVLGAVSAGIVITIGPPPEIPGYDGDLIQVGLQLRPGHSGGPMVDVAGRLVGINTMIAGPLVGLAIPLPVVKAFLKEKLGSGRRA